VDIENIEHNFIKLYITEKNKILGITVLIKLGQQHLPNTVTDNMVYTVYAYFRDRDYFFA